MTYKCDNCGKLYPLHLLDAKPKSCAGPDHSNRDMYLAGTRGEDFDRLECKTCYGPGWCEGVKE